MANIMKARETLAVIRANPHRLGMRTWVSGDVNPNATHWSECGTTLCFAGWQALLDGLRPECYLGSVEPTGKFLDTDGKLIDAGEHAMTSLELTESQTDAIFYRTQITNIDDLEWVVETVMSGHWRFCDYCIGTGLDVDDDDDKCDTCSGRGIVLGSDETEEVLR